jgi:membrane carboxypeptidase/penicillin-binding protein PbpC
MTYAYSVLANLGVMAGQPVPDEAQRPGFRQLDPVSVLRIEDGNGQVLYEHLAPNTQPILSPPLAYLINDVLSDSEARAAAFGRGNPLELPDRPAAAKTGTTNDFRDNWTLGYVPQLSVGVWVGNSDSSPMQGVTGLSGAAPIWRALMQYATQTRNLPPLGWDAPAGIVRGRVCEPSGLLPTRYCQRIREEVFLSGNEPVTADTMWQPVVVNRETNKRATACTPPELVETRIYQILPPEAADWARAVNLPQPPGEYDPIGAQCLPVGNVAVLAPKPFAYLRGVVEITGAAQADNFAFFRVQYGRGLYPTEYTQIGGDRPEQIEPPGALLQLWDTTGLDGLYLLQLVVVKNDPNGGPFQFETSEVPVTVDNQPPTVQVLTPAPGAEFDLSDESVVIQPQVQDNLSLARVEIYVDNALIETATVAPYSTRWRMRGAGQHVLFVRAFDAAGNFAESERVPIVVR